jgi:hypothetical protein
LAGWGGSGLLTRLCVKSLLTGNITGNLLVSAGVAEAESLECQIHKGFLANSLGTEQGNFFSKQGKAL